MVKKTTLTVLLVLIIAGSVNAQVINPSQYEETSLSAYKRLANRVQSRDTQKFKASVVFSGQIDQTVYFDDFAGENLTAFRVERIWPAMGKNQAVTIYFTSTGKDSRIIDDIDFSNPAAAVQSGSGAKSGGEPRTGNSMPQAASLPAGTEPVKTAGSGITIVQTASTISRAPMSPAVAIMIPPMPRVPPAPSAPPPPAKVLGAAPQKGSNGIYRLQVGSYRLSDEAVRAFNKLKGVGLNPAYEKYEDYTRVVFTGIWADDVPRCAELIGAAGFREIWCRKEG